MRHAVLLRGRHLGERPVAALRHEDRVPTEATALPRRRGNGAPGFPARGHDLAPVTVGDGADRGRASILERVEHAWKRGDAGARLDPLHEGARETSPRPDREAAVLHEDRT